MQTVGTKSTCSACGKVTYDNPKATTGLLLYSPDKKYFIVSTRAGEPKKGKLDTFGGFLEPYETLEAGTLRELNEEAGLSADEIGEIVYLGSTAHEYEWGGYITYTSAAWFMAELRTERPLEPSDDVESIVRLPVDQIPQTEEFAWEGMREIFIKAAQLLAD